MKRKRRELINRCHPCETGDRADDEPGPERLLLRFVAEQLLTRYRASPAAHEPKHQQRGLRYPAPGPARRHFIHAVNRQRQDVDQQEPNSKGPGRKNAAERRSDQEQITTPIEIHIFSRSFSARIETALYARPAARKTRGLSLLPRLAAGERRYSDRGKQQYST